MLYYRGIKADLPGKSSDMNKIVVHRDYPASRLPDDLKSELGAAERVDIQMTVVVPVRLVWTHAREPPGTWVHV